MLYNLRNEYERRRFQETAAALTEAGARVELTRKAERRTLAQNAYLHVLLGYYATEFGLTREEVKFEVFKKECNTELFEAERVNRRGQTVRYIRSTRDLTTAELTTAIERFRNYSAAVAGLYLPEPNEEEALFYAQQQIELCKEYL